jgi:hypothetical protein
MYARIAASVLALVLAVASLASAQERFGSLTGKVVDPQGLALPGVTVTVTNNETKRSTVVVTDSEGAFLAQALEPGRYAVKFELAGFVPKEAPDVTVALGSTATVNSSLAVGGLTETVQVLAETPLIDLGASTRQRNIPAEQFDVIPKARSFQSLATALPSVNTGELEGGFQVNGASAGENNFQIDGVPVTSVINGAQRQDAVFEYLQEVQVRTTGLQAEYGGALGGVISAVTKSGGNTFRGSVYEHYSSSWMKALNGLDKRLVLDPATQNTAYTVADDAQSFNRNEFGGSIGGPIVRDRLFFFGAVSPRVFRQTRDYTLTTGEVVPLETEQTSGSYFGKVSVVPSNRLQFNFSGLMTPTKLTGVTTAFDGARANTFTGSKENIEARRTQGWESPQWNLAYTGDYTVTNSTLASVRGGYLSDNYWDTGVNKSQTFEYATSAVGLAGVPAQFQQPAGYSNLPRVQIKDHDKTTRNFVDLSLSQTVNAAGIHQFKGGFGYSRATNDVNLAYPNGGYVTVFWNSVYESNVPGIGAGTGTYGYYSIDNIGTQGKTGANILSLYVQDNWNIGSRLSLNLGVRTESEDIPSFRPDIAPVAIHFGWKDKLAPRLGFAYNLTGDGRTKISGSYGRFFDWTK